VTAALGERLQAGFSTLFQISTAGALVEGVHEGAVSIHLPKGHGDLGLGRSRTSTATSPGSTPGRRSMRQAVAQAVRRRHAAAAMRSTPTFPQLVARAIEEVLESSSRKASLKP